MSIFSIFKRRKNNVSDLTPINRESSTEDITLFCHTVFGYIGDKPAHLGERGIYQASKRSVLIETWGPDGTKGNEYPIPNDVPKNREAIVAYLRETCGITIRD